MARKDKPYLPLYVQDFMTDERLVECSALATGVYIRVMCIMHKSEQYGTILLKQKDKQNIKQIENFCLKLAKQLPYEYDVILTGLEELIAEGCLQIEGDLLIQKRMVSDHELSLKRSNSGSIGGKNSRKGEHIENNFAQANSQANVEANTDNEIEIKELGSERVKDVANEVWKDQIWKEQICMGLGMKMDELQKWLAMFNSSIASDKVPNFDKSAYKKMSRGWIQKQKQKGTVVETGLAKTSTAPTLTRL
jgi:hypothetical protein